MATVPVVVSAAPGALGSVAMTITEVGAIVQAAQAFWQIFHQAQQANPSIRPLADIFAETDANAAKVIAQAQAEIAKK